MPDNLNVTGPQDGKLIAFDQYHEIRYWSERFGVSEHDLRAAAFVTGTNSAAKISVYLAEQGHVPARRFDDEEDGA